MFSFAESSGVQDVIIAGLCKAVEPFTSVVIMFQLEQSFLFVGVLSDEDGPKYEVALTDIAFGSKSKLL